MMRSWTTAETIKLIALYHQMLDLQRDGKLGPAASKGQISKAKLVRDFIEDNCPDRNKQSVEMKLMNVSGARKDLGLDEIVTGYKPLANGAQLIAELVGGAK